MFELACATGKMGEGLVILIELVFYSGATVVLAASYLALVATSLAAARRRRHEPEGTVGQGVLPWGLAAGALATSPLAGWVAGRAAVIWGYVAGSLPLAQARAEVMSAGETGALLAALVTLALLPALVYFAGWPGPLEPEAPASRPGRPRAPVGRLIAVHRGPAVS